MTHDQHNGGSPSKAGRASAGRAPYVAPQVIEPESPEALQPRSGGVNIPDTISSLKTGS